MDPSGEAIADPLQLPWHLIPQATLPAVTFPAMNFSSSLCFASRRRHCGSIAVALTFDSAGHCGFFSDGLLVLFVFAYALQPSPAIPKEKYLDDLHHDTPATVMMQAVHLLTFMGPVETYGQSLVEEIILLTGAMCDELESFPQWLRKPG